MEAYKKDHPAQSLFRKKRVNFRKLFKILSWDLPLIIGLFYHKNSLKEKRIGFVNLDLLGRQEASSSNQRHSSETQNYYDVYRNRIMFPIVTSQR